MNHSVKNFKIICPLCVNASSLVEGYFNLKKLEMKKLIQQLMEYFKKNELI